MRIFLRESVVGFGFFLLYLLATTWNCAAGELRLTGNGPLEWNPDITPTSPIFSIGVVEDPLQGTAGALLTWQLELSVVGTPLSTGNLKISEVSLPPASNYLFGAMSLGLTPSSLASPTDHITAIGDAEATFIIGVPVPSGGKQLLDLRFEADVNAEGVFQLLAHPYVPLFDGSNWISDTFDPFPFANLDATDGSVVLGTITIVHSTAQQSGGLVPEPSSQYLIAGSLLLYALNFGQMRKRFR